MNREHPVTFFNPVSSLNVSFLDRLKVLKFVKVIIFSKFIEHLLALFVPVQ